MASDRHADEVGQPAMRTRLAAALGGSQVTHSELEEYVDQRYDELQEQIMDTNLNDYATDAGGRIDVSPDHRRNNGAGRVPDSQRRCEMELPGGLGR